MKKEIDILILLDLASEDYSSDPRVFRTAYYLSNKGYQVAIAGFESGKKEIRLNENLTIYNIIPEGVNSFKSIFRLRQNVAKELNSLFSFTHIIANDHVMLNIGKRLKLMNPKAKLFYDSHEFFQDYQLEFFQNESLVIKLKSILWRKLETRNELKDVKFVDEIIASNQSIATIFETIFKPKNRVNVLRNIPDFNAKVGEDDLKKYNLELFQLLEQNKDSFNLIYFGNYMQKLNGMEYLLQAVQLLPKDVKLIILGTDKSKGHFDKMIMDLQIQERVIKIKKVPHDLMPVVANYAKISVVPTLYNNYLQCLLSLPNKFLESIKSKLPVICINLPEQKQIIEMFKNGILVCESTDVANSIKEGVDEIYTNYELFKKNAEICNEHFDVNFDLEKIAQKIERNAK